MQSKIKIYRDCIERSEGAKVIVLTLLFAPLEWYYNGDVRLAVGLTRAGAIRVWWITLMVTDTRDGCLASQGTKALVASI
jgi:hypothetical protein